MLSARSVLRPLLSVLFFLVSLLFLSTRPAAAISGRTVFTRVGTGAGDQFGYSVASAGDFDADGHPDVIMGAPFNDGGGGSSGRAYLSSLIFTGAAGEELGFSVASAGDFNGDGFDDLIIGAPLGAATNGRAYIYYGGPSPNTVADVTLTGLVAGDFFGGSVAGAGDVNGDGFDDVIVGAQNADPGALANAGQAFVFYGGSAPNNVADNTLNGTFAGDLLGMSVSGAGDFNRDGFDDVIVGASSSDVVGLNLGAAFILYGGLVANGVADITLGGEVAADNFGASVSSAGDVNGDGYPDVIVGAELNDAGGVNAGRAYVFFGGADGDATADLTLTGLAGDLLGDAVGAAGDVNGDGFADVIVGATNAGTGTDGVARIYLGGTAPNATADLTVAASPEGGALGWAVASAGDVDGDGYSDIVIGDPVDDSVLANGGKVYFVSVFPYQILSPNGGETWVAGAPATVRWRGHDVADLAISTDGGLTYSTIFNSIGGVEENEFTLTAPDTPTDRAKVRLTFRGQTATRGTSDVSDGVFRIVQPAPPPVAASRLQLTPTGAAAAFLGISVASAGDMNGDSFDDFIVGAFNVNAGAGAAYVYLGGPGADAVADLTLNGEAAGDNFGSEVAAAGDVNGDGYGDVIVGAPSNDAGGANAGRAYVYYGGAAPDATADLTLTGEAAGDNFGESAASAGDFNRDGFADVIVGASGNDGGGASAGRTYLYYGGGAPNNVVDLTFSGVAGDQSGNSVAPAGDVNGDGFGDVIVGVFAHDIAGGGSTVVNVGEARVFFGGRTPDNVADLVLSLSEPVASDLFGASVASADMDGDGFSDLIVGANARDDAGGGAGAAYVFAGGPGADSTPELILLGAAAGDGFGVTVASAGDVNRDGFADVIVGASGNDAGGADAGQAYVFYGGPFGTPGGTSADATLTGAAAGDQYGITVASAGDISGDGFDDVIVGARFNDAGGVEAGRAYVYDFNRYHLLAPNGGETWNVGGSQTISWLGAEPADLWLSVDAGRSFDRLLAGVGGLPSNNVSVQVPHAPTKFAMIKVSPSDPSVTGQDVSAARFTIQASVGLLSFVAQLGEAGAELKWETDPGVGPQGLMGYRLYRLVPGSTGIGTRIGPDLITEAHFADPDGVPGTAYRLTAVNGFLEELELGRVTAGAAIVGLHVWPSPLRNGSPLNVAFVAPLAGSGYLATDLDVGLFDIHGRRVATLAHGPVAPRTGVVSLTWSFAAKGGDGLAPGIYFVRAAAPSAGYQDERKVVVIQ